MSMPRILAAMLVIAMLAGCAATDEEDSEPVVDIPDDAPSHQDAHPGDGFELRVRVTDLNGTPIQGAAVVFFTGEFESAPKMPDRDATKSRPRPADPRDGMGDSPEGTAGAAGGGVFWSVQVGEHERVAGARTDADGFASADLKPKGSIHVAAGDVDGMTTELMRAISLGDAGGSADVTLALFPDSRTVTFQATADILAPAAVPGGAGYSKYANYAISFHPDSVLDARFHERLHRASITMSWTNLPTQAGDLLVGLAAGDKTPFLRGDDELNVAPGKHTESLDATADKLKFVHPAIASERAHAAAMTDSVAVGVEGIELSFVVEANFKGIDFKIN